MRIKFNKLHVQGLRRDIVLSLNTKYNKSGETEFIVEDTDFSGQQLLQLAKEGVEMDSGMRTFLKAAPGFLSLPYGEITMGDYLAEHMRVETADYTLVLMQANGSHFTGKQIVEFSQYGEILNIDEYYRLKDGQELTIEEIDKDPFKYFKDYKKAREELKKFADGRELTIEEAKILAKWFILPTSNILTLLTPEEYEQASKIFNKLSIQSREARYEELKRFVRVELGIAEAQALMGQVISNRFDDLYIHYGQEGTMKVNFEGTADPYGIFNVIEDMLDISSELKAKALDILDNGNY